MDYRIKVKAYVCIDEMDYQLDPSKIIEVEVPVTENKWKSEMEILFEEIECNLEDEEFFAESDGEGIDNDSYNYYVDNYGMLHNGNNPVPFICIKCSQGCHHRGTGNQPPRESKGNTDA